MIYIEEINNLKLTFDEILIMLLFILFFFLLILLVIKLKKRNKNLEYLLNKTNEELLKKKYSEETNNNEIPIQTNIPLEKLDKVEEEISLKIPIIEEEKIKTENESLDNTERKPYQKNILKNIKAPTSPINLNNQSTIKELKMNLNDFIKKERKNGNNIKILTSKDYENNTNSNVNYMEEVSKRLEKATENIPIELTDYEKIQEEQAIISYQELIDNKDKIYQLNDDEADIEFINELKNFRESLNNK